MYVLLLPVPTDPLGMGIAVFLLAPVAADPVVAVAELAVLKSMAAYSALFSGSSISIDGTPPQLCFRRHFHNQNISFCTLSLSCFALDVAHKNTMMNRS